MEHITIAIHPTDLIGLAAGSIKEYCYGNSNIQVTVVRESTDNNELDLMWTTAAKDAKAFYDSIRTNWSKR